MMLYRERWTPFHDTGLRRWWNADDLPAGAVASWRDRVRGDALAQSSTTIQPTNSLTMINGFPGVNFSNSMYLESTNSVGLPLGTEACLIAMALTCPTSTGLSEIPFAYGGTVGTTSRRIFRLPSGFMRIQDGVFVDMTVLVNSQPRGYIAKFDFNVEGFATGSSFIAASSDLSSLSYTTTRMGMNCGLAGFCFNGAIRHTLITTDVSTANLLRYSAWLEHEIGTQANLPSWFNPTIRPVV